MPGAVGRTSTFALCNVTLPWVVQIANESIEAAATKHRPISAAVNIYQGKVTNSAVAETFDMPYVEQFPVERRSN
jgi:alanine dehydrogenase